MLLPICLAQFHRLLHWHWSIATLPYAKQLAADPEKALRTNAALARGVIAFDGHFTLKESRTRSGDRCRRTLRADLVFSAKSATSTIVRCHGEDRPMAAAFLIRAF